MIAFRQEYASLKQQTGIMNSEHLTKDFKAKMDAGDKQLEHAIVDSSPYAVGFFGSCRMNRNGEWDKHGPIHYCDLSSPPYNLTLQNWCVLTTARSSQYG